MRVGAAVPWLGDLVRAAGPDGVTWRARPRMLINADDPEDLAAAIRAADNPVIPDWVLLASPRVTRPGCGGSAGWRHRPGLRGGARRSAESARRGVRFPRRGFRLAWPKSLLINGAGRAYGA